MTTTEHNLREIISRWGDLADMLTTHHGAPWPPAGRMTDYLAQLNAIDREEARQRRAEQRAAERNPDQIGEAPAPIRLGILDTARMVEVALVHLADAIAAAIQRAPAKEVRAAGPLDVQGLKLHTASLTDASYRGRWSWSDDRTRTGAHAALWLLARIENVPGPFQRLTLRQREDIASVAATAVQRIEQALDLTRRAVEVDQPCPHCRGRLHVEGGDGQAPAVKCRDCGRTWREQEAAA